MAKANEGKLFEKDFMESIGCFKYRLKDAGGWSNGENTRFTPSNDCDLIVYKTNLYMVELKSTKAKSVPITKMKQLDRMLKHKEHKGVELYFIFNFRTQGETYAVTVEQVKEVLENKKSININDCAARGKLIPQALKIKRYRYITNDLFV